MRGQGVLYNRPIRSAMPQETPLIYLERWRRALARVQVLLNRPRLSHEPHPLRTQRVLAIIDHSTDLANAVSAECLGLARNIWAAQESPLKGRSLNRMELPGPDCFAAMRLFLTGHAGYTLAARQCLFVYVAGIVLECEGLSGAGHDGEKAIVEQHSSAFADCVRAYSSLHEAVRDFTQEPRLAEHAFTKWERSDSLSFLRLCERVFEDE